MSKLSKIFEGGRVVGCIGESNTGKSNNLVFLIKDFRQENKTSKVVVYGFKEEVSTILKEEYGCLVVDTLEHLSQCKDCLIIMDEFQKLKLGDRRYKDLTDEFFDFIHHNNNWVILSSPNLAEFNKLICNKVKTWLVKSLHVKKLVNGSEVKRLVDDYKGQRKRLNYLNIAVNELLLYSSKGTSIIECEYVPEVDKKASNVSIFVKENVKDIVKKKTEKKTVKCLGGKSENEKNKM